MTYTTDGEAFQDIDSVLNYCIEDDYHEDDMDFEEWVNDMYGSIDICGDTYYAYDILDHASDGNITYAKERFCEERNGNDREEAEYELRHAVPGDDIEVQRYVVHVWEDQEEDDDEVNIEAINECRQRLEQERNSTSVEDDEFMKLFMGG